MAEHEALSEHVCDHCGQPFRAEQHHAICPTCVEARMSEYDDGDDEEICEHGNILEECCICDFDCGLMRDGQCTKAGSEECDFSCPNRDSELFAGSAAWVKKHQKAKA